LSEALNVSRNSVREAINKLVILGFLEQRQGQGTFVRSLDEVVRIPLATVMETQDASLIDLLEEMTQHGTRIVYVEGNHDFHLGPVFTDRLQCQVMPDGGSIDLDGKEVYLAHGDLANPHDLNYRRLRKFLRSGFIRSLIRILPNRILMTMASKASYESRKSGSDKRQRWPARDILLPYAKKMIVSGYDVVITAHYHQPLYEKVGDGELIALGDWISQFSYAVYEDQIFTLTEYQSACSSSGDCSG
jgi:UDP-2,3-diacylglucosamine hydrolase